MKDKDTMTLDSEFFLERDLECPELRQIAGGIAEIFCRTCPGCDGPNEDAAALIRIDDARGVLALADGAGGMPAGAIAAETALRVFEQALHHAMARGVGVRHGIVDGFEDANRALLAQGIGSATTLTVVEIEAGSVRTYHVGDSAAMVVGRKGKTKHSTIAHSPVGYAVEAGFLDEAEAMVHEDRHLVSNLVGSREMRIEIGPRLGLAPYDTVLLASDGALDNLEPELIVETIRKGELSEAANHLARRCQKNMKRVGGLPCKPDDLSFILFRYSSVRRRRPADRKVQAKL